MIIAQLILWIFLSCVAAAFLRTADLGGTRVSGSTVTLLGFLWLPLFGVLAYGYGTLSGLTVHFGIGDSPEVMLNSGYRMVLVDGRDGLLCQEPWKEQLVSNVVQVGETADHFYGLTREGAFAVHKRSGRVREASDLPSLQNASFTADALSPVHQFPGRPETGWDLILFAALFIGPLLAAWILIRLLPERSVID